MRNELLMNSYGYALYKIIFDENDIVADYEFLSINEEFCNLFTKDENDLIGRKASKVFPTIFDLLIKTYNNSSNPDYPLILEKYDDDIDKYIRILAYTVFPQKFVTIIQDITYEKNNEQKISKQNLVLKRKTTHLNYLQKTVDIFNTEDNTIKENIEEILKIINNTNFIPEFISIGIMLDKLKFNCDKEETQIIFSHEILGEGIKKFKIIVFAEKSLTIQIENSFLEEIKDFIVLEGNLIFQLAAKKIIMEELDKKNQRILKSFKYFNFALWEWDIQKGSILISEKFNDILESEKIFDTIDLKTWIKLIKKDDRKEFIKSLNELKNGNLPAFNIKSRITNYVNKTKWIDNYGLVINRDEKGKPSLVSGFILDISERIRAQELVEKRQEFDRIYSYILKELTKFDDENINESIKFCIKNFAEFVNVEEIITYSNDEIFRKIILPYSYSKSKAANLENRELILEHYSRLINEFDENEIMFVGQNFNENREWQFLKDIFNCKNLVLMPLKYGQGSFAICFFIFRTKLIIKKEISHIIFRSIFEILNSLFSKGIEIIEKNKIIEESHKLLRAVEQSPNSIIITDPNGFIEYINPKFTETTGYRLNELIGKTPSILKSGYMDSEDYRELWDTIKSGKEWHGEFYNKIKDGTYLWEEVSISAVRNPSGEITHFIAIKENISPRKEKEQTQRYLFNISDILLKNEEIVVIWTRLRFLLIDFFVSNNVDIVLNPNIEKIILRNKSDLELIQKKKIGLYDWAVLEIMLQEVEKELINIINNSDGRFILVPVYLENILNAVIIIDYTDKEINVRVEKNNLEFISNQVSILLEREINRELINIEKEELSITLESLSEGVLTTDTNGKILYANKSVEQILNIRKDSLLNNTINTVFWNSEDKGIEVIKDYYNNIRRGNRLTLNRRFTITFSQGKKRIIDVNTSLILQNDRNVKSIIFVIKDITQQLQMETRISLSQKMESVGQLAAGIAHEINTPMQFIGDNTSFLKDAFDTYNNFIESIGHLYDSESEEKEKIKKMIEEYDLEYFKNEIPEAIKQSQSGIDRVRKLVLSMKEFSHPSQKVKNYYNLNKAIETTVTISKNEWKYFAEMKLELNWDLTDIFCLIDEINQVILNMIVNAAHAIEARVKKGDYEKGEINISTKQDGEFVEVQIKDNGTGIPKNLQSRIYEPFFTTKEVGKGTGQGLAIVHDIIVNKHGGRIILDSTEGKGTTFIIRLPLNKK